MAGDWPIDGREMRAILAYLERALQAGSEAEQEAALGEGIVAWGEQFMQVLTYAGQQQPAWRPLQERAVHLFTSWLGGRKLTRRADEDERRAVIAVSVARKAPTLARLAVEGFLRAEDMAQEAQEARQGDC